MKMLSVEQSNKGTESTMPMQFKKFVSQEPQSQWKQLYKEGSQSSSQQPIKLQLKEDTKQHEEIKKFLKKGDEINLYNYKKLEKDKPSFPQNSSNTNLYKSSRNILEEISRESKPPPKSQKKPQPKPRKMSYVRKKLTEAKEIQTQDVQQPPPKYDKIYNQLNSIVEDGEEEKALEKKSRRRYMPVKNNPKFNTISLTVDPPRKWSRNLKNQLGENRYSVNKEPEQRTIFHEQRRVNQIANRTYENFWGSQKKQIREPEKPQIKLEPVERKKVSEQKKTQSLIVEDNNSIKHTEPTTFLFNKESNIYSSKVQQKEQNKQISIQVPQVSQLVIGSNQPQNLKQIHPINIDFSETDANWITNVYKPKSQFLKKINLQHFQIKKYKNGVYFGQLQDGVKNGKGVIFYFNGRSYEGNFNKDMKEGKGFQFFPDGSVYKGDFSKGFKEGRGVFEWPNGQVYDGQWQEGRKNGSGMWKGPDGDSYLGEWKKGRVQGFGVFVSNIGDRYEGEFKNSMKHGLGTERYASGDTYVGLFLKNRPNGQGQVYYKNGDYYKGQFSNGLKHGKGYLKEDDGPSYKGEFRNDKRCGLGQLVTEEGSTFVGNFQNDLKHGYGQIYQNGQTVASGYWMSDKKVQSSMSYMDERYANKNKSISNSKSKSKKKRKRSPKTKNKSLEKSLSPKGNYQRACGCKRKH